MHTRMKLLFGASVLLAASGAQASVSTGTVNHVYTMSDGQILFQVSNDRTRPACATSPGRWAFNSATAAGQARLAVLLTAYAQHKTVYVLGTDTCDVWGDTESINWLRTEDS